MGEERIVVRETRDVEGIDSDTKIVSDIREGDREIEIMVESTKIGEERVDEARSGEEMKGREVRITGEECERVTTGSSAWPLHITSALNSSDLLVFFVFVLLFGF